MALALSNDHKALAEVVRDFAAANDLRALARVTCGRGRRVPLRSLPDHCRRR